ncbi:hypothetical protein Tco_0710225 [Tanacetum coccineum]
MVDSVPLPSLNGSVHMMTSRKARGWIALLLFAYCEKLVVTSSFKDILLQVDSSKARGIDARVMVSLLSREEIRRVTMGPGLRLELRRVCTCDASFVSLRLLRRQGAVERWIARDSCHYKFFEHPSGGGDDQETKMVFDLHGGVEWKWKWGRLRRK